ncbi:hypothetical protein LNKW23_06450 [Paralimibaculum aggregatum]|uniref:Uncharacterized protein n=1 Tax=Paralimibaculum aggregatum TaxID=3036245 RepID=A0ABQ6LEM3_9RHOB|nr:hypothetical protein [Limibaculum sp. NKW23]GMG81432.1 hypothetical protein LNKW23_06450 [Limibaculum sp. NKW23]
MGATVVDTSLKVATWNAAKPKSYKGADLTNALKAYETATKKDIMVLAKLPDFKVSKLEGARDVYSTAATELKKVVTALGSIDTAGTKTHGELTKQAKTKEGDEKKQYEDAAAVARTMSLSARTHRQKLS